MNCCRPVQMLALPKFKSALMVPEVVMGLVPPRERVLLGVAKVMEVTVPFVAPIQTPFLEKQPLVILRPLARVLVAEPPV